MPKSIASLVAVRSGRALNYVSLSLSLSGCSFHVQVNISQSILPFPFPIIIYLASRNGSCFHPLDSPLVLSIGICVQTSLFHRIFALLNFSSPLSHTLSRWVFVSYSSARKFPLSQTASCSIRPFFSQLSFRFPSCLSLHP